MRRQVLALALAGAVLGLAAGPSRGEDRRDVEIRMDEVEIRGEVERPGVFYIIPRRSAPLDLGPRTRDYRAEILEPVLPHELEREIRRRARR